MSSKLADLVNGFAGRKVVVLGDVMLDRSVFGVTDRISPEAPVPVLRVTGTSASLGGAGNVARNVARLGGEAILIGVLGTDAAADEFATLSRLEPGFRLACVRDPERCTSVKTRFIAQAQHLLRVDDERLDPVPAALEREMLALLDEALDGASALVLSDYAKGVFAGALAGEAIALARARGTFVVVDPKLPPFGRFSGADVLTPNGAEAQRATGIGSGTDDSAAAAARAFAGAAGGDCAVVLTRGSAGMTVLTRDGEIANLPTVGRDVFDVSGAGDTVVAVLALNGASSLLDGARLANAAAGIAVGKLGTAAIGAGELERTVRGFGAPERDAKIVSLGEASSRAEEWRRAGQRVVFTNGCFDLIHPGHLHLLRQARACGDRLVVALNTDSSVRRLKGQGRPLQDESARAHVLASFETVDLVILFPEDTPLAAIERVRPDVLVKGADYAPDSIVGADFVRSSGGRVVVAALLDGYSTTSIARRAAGSG